MNPAILVVGLALASPMNAAATGLVAHPQPPSLAQLASGPCQYYLVQGRPFWFTLGGGDDSPVHIRTLEKIALADRGLNQCAVGEWEYSFHHLKNGQADGSGYKHYGGYPTPPLSRTDAMECIRRYYLHLRDDAMAKATPEQRKLFCSFNGHYCYQHYGCEWGCDLVGSEVGENINSIQTHIAFTRGAARQYGKPWLMDFSSWYGPSIFDEDPRRTWGENSGPTHGHSLSLHLRTYFVSYMAGANVVVAEGGSINCFKSQEPGPDGTLPLSTLGEKAAYFYRFTRRHPDRGVPYAPVALLLPFDHGIYPGFGKKLAWNAFPYTHGDQRILDALNVLFPGSLGDPEQPERPDRQPGNPAWKDPDYMHTESLRLVRSPYGDIVDVLLSNAQPEVLNSYPVLLLAGEYAPDQAFAERLTRYVEKGGILLIDQADQRNGIFPTALVSRLPSPPPGGYARFRMGRGAIVVVASSNPGHPTTERPLAKVMSQVRQELVPLEVSGRVETLYNRTKDGWLVTLVNNEGVTKTFRDPVVVDASATQSVSITSRGKSIRQAVLWGADNDEQLSPKNISVSVPPGEVRIVQIASHGSCYRR
jgi:hypothetical protein